jgi:hypothetical protein
MGMNKDIYIGAYLKIDAGTQVEKTIMMQCKNHPENKYPEEISFCNLCGSELKKIVEGETTSKSYYDLFETEQEEEKWEDELQWISSEDDDTLIRLVGNKFYDNIDGNFIEYGDTEITPKMPSQYMENFRENYTEIIKFLRDRVKTMEIKFGVLVYYS